MGDPEKPGGMLPRPRRRRCRETWSHWCFPVASGDITRVLGHKLHPLSVWTGPQGPRELACEKVIKAGDVLAYASSLHVPNTACDSEAREGRGRERGLVQAGDQTNP